MNTIRPKSSEEYVEFCLASKEDPALPEHVVKYAKEVSALAAEFIRQMNTIVDTMRNDSDINVGIAIEDLATASDIRHFVAKAHMMMTQRLFLRSRRKARADNNKKNGTRGLNSERVVKAIIVKDGRDGKGEIALFGNENKTPSMNEGDQIVFMKKSTKS